MAKCKMTPPNPAFPTATNLRFHPSIGSHTSNLISESGVGAAVAVTRQNGGSVL
jgi:hypothetical protein